MSDEESGGPGPESAEEYTGPGYPTVSNRRRHLKKLALAAGAVTVGGGLFVVGKELVKPSHGSGDGIIDSAKGWLTNLTSDPPPRLAGAAPMPPPEPRIRGDMAVPDHVDPTSPTCKIPKTPAPDDHPPLPGEMVMPEHVEPPPEPLSDPRIKGKVAMPVHEDYPDAAGGISEPVLEEAVVLHPPGIPEPPPEEPAITPPPPSGTVEGKFRSLYLTGATSDGTPFTVLLRVDPADEASYEALKAARKAILTALSPLVGTPELAQDQAASKLVTRLVPGATVRFAGVVR
jgi:hypothetical protein